MLTHSEPSAIDPSNLVIDIPNEKNIPKDQWSIRQPTLKHERRSEDVNFLPNEKNLKQRTYPNDVAKSFMVTRTLLNPK